MSRVYFHTESETAELRGSERAYAGWICGQLFVQSLNLSGNSFRSDTSPLKKILSKDSYLARMEGLDFNNNLSTALSAGFQNYLEIEGKQVNGFAAMLNTALVMGSDELKFLARMHGQCEIHAYIEGANKKWAEDLIARGLTCGLYRKDQGWEGVQTLLLANDAEPVVMSYSVCESFPNSSTTTWLPPIDNETDEYIHDAWYDLSEKEQWEMSMEQIRKDDSLELKPGNWRDFFFCDGMNGYKIFEYAVNLEG